MYVLNNNSVTYFDSFRVEHILKEIRVFIIVKNINNNNNTNNDNNENIITNIFRIQTYDSIMCGYFGFGFIDFFLQEKL